MDTVEIPKKDELKNSYDCHPGCAVEAALSLIDGKWKGVILFLLLDRNVMRFNAFQKALPNITQRVLTSQLRSMEADGLIDRTVYPVVPPKVEYRLTELGLSLEPVVKSLAEWGNGHKELWPLGFKRDSHLQTVK
ncbi:helix-turn-helix domain-containing protein [Roseibium porphyridii]|uniref:Helix-turn-helix domain-containing protein n=1 Tax=Roseibium porphyridii TaxID=2866279 RepID=A0ABY8EXR4_9HYPH|nr:MULTISPECIES: helix-turn-helix domain-containing protein [Stappiaceae]QFT32187.1 putative HTH-type transcriptional regulator YybR [Labrenzia sp. THAF82]WFE87561.1 helix-turn-helix domain-containing protein [Roseibium sp. KMA01]